MVLDRLDKGFYKKYENAVLASLLLLVLLLLVGIRYDYYYELNDDVLIKDLMAGVYTGHPEGHNIQVLYPLSLAISLLYRVFPEAPVYGIFLCLCQYGCIWLMAERSLGFCQRTWAKACLAAVEVLMVCTLLLPHLVFVQYTIVSALLSAAAAFLFITAPALPAGRFIRKNIPCVLLAVLSFQLRTEMMELLLPLICVAGVYRWSLEDKIHTRENYGKYLSVFGMILAGMAVSWIANWMAFQGEEWKAYVDFFNRRTELYDFQGIPPYEGNEGLYEGLGMEREEQQMLLEQYNFGLDDGLDAEILGAVAEYQDGVKKAGQSFLHQVREQLWVYRWRLWPAGKEGLSAKGVPYDYPWNAMAILGYAAVFLAVTGANARRGKGAAFRIGKSAGCLLFLFAVRSILWMFIMLRNREPVRITHSLYWMELSILLAMLHVEGCGLWNGWKMQAGSMNGKKQQAGEGQQRNAFGGVLVYIFTAAFALTACMDLPEAVGAVEEEYRARAAADEVYEGMKAYGKAHGGNFYFIDVYSAVSYPSEPYAETPYAEKMFVHVDNRLANYDIMGGWLTKSPSYRKKLEHFGISSMREGILFDENVYVMAELGKGTEYIVSYFSARGMEVVIEPVDTICGLIGVYRIEGDNGYAGNESGRAEHNITADGI